MRKNTLILICALLIIGLTISGNATTEASNDNPLISGSIVSGYRVLPIQESEEEIHLTVYRGDYIKFEFDKSISLPLLSIPDISIEETLPRDLNKAPYFKMKTKGTFAFTLGPVKGDITVIEYRQPNYKAVTSREAAEFIHNISPVILDVRTPKEYKGGHLKNAILIPVQELQARLKEITAYRNQDILVYCATGNRSTVASKILIDNGFKRIINLQNGIVESTRNNYQVVR